MKQEKKKPMIKTLHCVLDDNLDALIESAHERFSAGGPKTSRAEFVRFLIKKGLGNISQNQGEA